MKTSTQQEHDKLISTWNQLVGLMGKWEAKNGDLQQLTHISEDLEVMERYVRSEGRWGLTNSVFPFG